MGGSIQPTKPKNKANAENNFSKNMWIGFFISQSLLQRGAGRFNQLGLLSKPVELSDSKNNYSSFSNTFFINK